MGGEFASEGRSAVVAFGLCLTSAGLPGKLCSVGFDRFLLRSWAPLHRGLPACVAGAVDCNLVIGFAGFRAAVGAIVVNCFEVNVLGMSSVVVVGVGWRAFRFLLFFSGGGFQVPFRSVLSQLDLAARFLGALGGEDLYGRAIARTYFFVGSATRFYLFRDCFLFALRTERLWDESLDLRAFCLWLEWDYLLVWVDCALFMLRLNCSALPVGALGGSDGGRRGRGSSVAGLLGWGSATFLFFYCLHF